LSFLAAAAEVQKEFGAGGGTGGGLSGRGGAGSPVTVLTNLLMDDELPPEIRLVFRKLQKKDGVTKIKVRGQFL